MPGPPCSCSSSLTSGPLYLLSPLPETFSPPSAPLSNSYQRGLRWPGIRERKKDGVRNTHVGVQKGAPERNYGREQDLRGKLRLKEHSLFVHGVPWWAMLFPNSVFLSNIPHPSGLSSTALPPEAHCLVTCPGKCSRRAGTRTALYSWVGYILHNGLRSSIPTVTPGFGRRESLFFIPTKTPCVIGDPSASSCTGSQCTHMALNT